MMTEIFYLLYDMFAAIDIIALLNENLTPVKSSDFSFYAIHVFCL